MKTAQCGTLPWSWRPPAITSGGAHPCAPMGTYLPALPHVLYNTHQQPVRKCRSLCFVAHRTPFHSPPSIPCCGMFIQVRRRRPDRQGRGVRLQDPGSQWQRWVGPGLQADAAAQLAQPRAPVRGAGAAPPLLQPAILTGRTWRSGSCSTISGYALR